MAYFFYSDEKSAFTGNLSQLDPIACFLKHYDNYLFLNFVVQNIKDRIEKVQAVKELGICEKKMNFWKRTYNKQKAEQGIFELKKKWRQ